jgi:hypothetical protein
MRRRELPFAECSNFPADDLAFSNEMKPSRNVVDALLQFRLPKPTIDPGLMMGLGGLISLISTTARFTGLSHSFLQVEATASWA